MITVKTNSLKAQRSFVSFFQDRNIKSESMKSQDFFYLTVNIDKLSTQDGFKFGYLVSQMGVVCDCFVDYRVLD